ncbi:MAG: ABC transporter ATP-binding protein [Candidatus Competibacterales bacterium]
MFEIRGLRYCPLGPGDRSRGDPHRRPFVLHIDTLAIPHWGMTAVIGPSGAGKTTLLSLLAGFIQPETEPGGWLCFDGRDMTSAARHPPGEVGYVFQSPMLLRSGTGMLNALQGAVAATHHPKRAPAPMDRAEAAALFARLGLLDGDGALLTQRASALSGGEAQRIAVARALLTGAKAILCDEPTSSLDEANAEQVLQALGAWSRARGGRTVVWVTHNLAQAATHADHYLFLRGGQVVAPSAETANLLRSPHGAQRLAALRRLAKTPMDAPEGPAPVDAPAIVSRDRDHGGPGTEALPVATGEEASLPIPGRGRFFAWTAKALSTDGPVGQWFEGRGRTPFLEHGLGGWVAAVGGRRATPAAGTMPWALGARLMGLGRFVLAYSRWSLAVVLAVCLLQVYLAFALGKAAWIYHRDKLEDPAVARIGFEHVIGAFRADGDGPADLYPATLAALTEALRERLPPTAPPDLAERFVVFGQRQLQSGFRPVDPPQPACEGWFGGIATAILSAEDPLLGQTVLADPGGDPAGPRRDARQLVASHYGSPGGASGVATPGALIVDALFARGLQERCGFDPGDPIRLQWALRDTLATAAVELEVVAVAETMPPIYPLTPRIIAFERDFQAHLQAMETTQPPPIRIANVYFPLEYFDTVRDFVAARGYEQRTDSQAAVLTLRQTARLALEVPTLITALNLAIVAVVVAMVLGHILEINRRVLTLFHAYGFTWRDLATVLFRHLLPAASLGTLLLLATVFIAVPALPLEPPDFLRDFSAHRNEALLSAVAAVISSLGAATLLAVYRWWRRAGRQLSAFLKD